MRLSRKLNTWFWWIVSILPILFALFWSIGQGQGTGFTLFSAFISNMTGCLPPITNSISSALVDILTYFDFDMSNTSVLTYFCQYMGYYVVIQILHIAVSVLLFLPDFCHKVFHRLFGNDDA